MTDHQPLSPISPARPTQSSSPALWTVFLGTALLGLIALPRSRAGSLPETRPSPRNDGRTGLGDGHVSYEGTAAERLAETLRSWLLHQGRREEVAADLVVHPQTVRYRMTQLRELYGDRLTDPTTVLELTIALAVPPR